MNVSIAIILLSVCVPILAIASNSEIESMNKTHNIFTGRKGTFACFGDSITDTMAFWASIPNADKNIPKEMNEAKKVVTDYMIPECWREWKGEEYGNKGTMTARWAYDNIDKWLNKLNPEVALIMFGTNDLHSLELDEYQTKMRKVVQKCLDNGTIVILSTIPPRSGFEDKSEQFSYAIRNISKEYNMPLIDYHAEILKHRPDDWDGSMKKFDRWEGYDVPTLISRDGVHPSYPKNYIGDYSKEALKSSGYNLRNYLTLIKYAEVIKTVLADNAIIKLLSQDWYPKAPSLPSPAGEIIRVTNVDEFFRAVEDIKPNGTILLTDGHYIMPRYIEIRTDNVTLRSESGQRDRVIIDGKDSIHGELVGIRSCSGVTIADLTIQNIKWNGIKINSDSNVQNVTIYNCVIHNIWQRGVKGVKVPKDKMDEMCPKNCRVQYCLFYNDHAKRFEDDPADTIDNFGGNYIGGIDTMYAKDWVISDNVFIGIQGRTRSARGAIFIWHDSKGCIVERNIIIDCDTGIALGNSHKAEETDLHCFNFIVRNNFITRAPENGIVADYTKDCKIINNTIHDPQNRLGRLIRLVHDNDGLLVANNLLSGPKIRNESQSNIVFMQNYEGDITEYFIDAEKGNLHIKSQIDGVTGKAISLQEVNEDIDRQKRKDKPDIGADELY
ncbi:TPA: hypothetical protein ENS27_04855 [bacterium]|nr:hypothetical protein [bacterium]